MDPQVELKALLKNQVRSRSFFCDLLVSLTVSLQAECLKRTESSSSSLVPTFTIFLRRASFPLVNRSSIPTLLRRLKRPDNEDLAEMSKIVLNYIARGCPIMYKMHVSELARLLGDDNARLVETALYALAELAGSDANALPKDRYEGLLLPSAASLLTFRSTPAGCWRGQSTMHLRGIRHKPSMRPKSSLVRHPCPRPQPSSSRYVSSRFPCVLPCNFRPGNRTSAPHNRAPSTRFSSPCAM
jgi:hypothetical protein